MGFQIAEGSHCHQGSCSEITGSARWAPGKADGLQLQMLGTHDQVLGIRAERWLGFVESFGRGLGMMIGDLGMRVGN